MSSHSAAFPPHIVDAAERLLESKPDFTMDDLGAAVNLSRATLYRKIGSKEALLHHLANERGLTQAISDDIRTRILRAARAMFGRYGFLHVTMEQIAQEAEVGVATLYRHFGDKEGLVRSFASEMTPHRLIADAAQHISGDLAADLRHIVRHLLQFMDENRDWIRLGFSQNQITQQYLAHIRPAPDRTLYQLTHFFETQREAGHLPREDIEQLALALSGLIFGFGFLAPLYYDKPLKDGEAVAEFIVTLFLEGIDT